MHNQVAVVPNSFGQLSQVTESETTYVRHDCNYLYNGVGTYLSATAWSFSRLSAYIITLTSRHHCVVELRVDSERGSKQMLGILLYIVWLYTVVTNYTRVVYIEHCLYTMTQNY